MSLGEYPPDQHTHTHTHTQAGVVIIFDELFNYPEYAEGELLAFWQLMRERRDLAVEVVGTSTRNISIDWGADTAAATYTPVFQSCAVRLVLASAAPKTTVGRGHLHT